MIQEIEGVPQQQVKSDLPYIMEYMDFSQLPEPDAQLETWVHNRKQITFDFSKRLFDSVLIKLSYERLVWYLNQHHIIGDATSGVAALIFQRPSVMSTR